MRPCSERGLRRLEQRLPGPRGHHHQRIVSPEGGLLRTLLLSAFTAPLQHVTAVRHFQVARGDTHVATTISCHDDPPAHVAPVNVTVVVVTAGVRECVLKRAAIRDWSA